MAIIKTIVIGILVFVGIGLALWGVINFAPSGQDAYGEDEDSMEDKNDA